MMPREDATWHGPAAHHARREFETVRIISGDHPSLEGHFPTDPIVPGVLLLDEVAAAAAQWRGKDCQVTAIPNVKFLLPLRPQQPFTIHFTSVEASNKQVDFCCQAAGRTIAQGRLEIVCHE